MKKRYIHFTDVEKEIESAYSYISSVEEDMLKEKKRVELLEVLADYLANDGLCPFAKKDLLSNDMKLQEYVTPILCKKEIMERQQYQKSPSLIEYSATYDTVAKIINDFIKFVCEIKGQRIGVGEYHIRRFMQEKVR